MTYSRRRFLELSAAASTLAAVGPLRALEPGEALPKGKKLTLRQENPLNAEPKLQDLATDDLTKSEHFYVRNHGDVPQIDVATWKLRIEGLVNKPLELSLAELRQQCKDHEAAVTITCAGNRRAEMSRIKPVSGVAWEAGAIGCGKFTGPKLSDVLNQVEVKAEASHVWFEGLDNAPIPGGKTPFGGSIPLDRAMAEDLPAILAHSMNAQPLSSEHGFPLRSVVPGCIGARSVKWLAKITLADRPSPNHFVADTYKLIQTDNKAEIAAAEPIYDFAVNSAICAPAAGARLPAGRNEIRGYALPAGSASVKSVELSLDQGKNWKSAKLGADLGPANWRLWSIAVDLPKGKHTLTVRATDSAGNTQPESGAWNLKGYLYNGWHRVSVEVA